ncbi:MAG: DUF1127 domain-containing protein [Alphaproteobacteria bacterium]|nr:DUF1127 domain-containing protein [Alphaproteobacteria bacterium]
MGTIQLSHRPAAYSGPGSPDRYTGKRLDLTVGGVWSLIKTAARLSVETLLLWQERYRMRRKLLELDNRMLEDIGLSRAEIWREASKPFWRA